MTTEKDYVERLEKIVDKQDALLSQLDSNFKQQDSLNEYLTKQNNFLKEDIQKHKNLTRDMHKTLIQQKNVVNSVKKELEDQLKIQQDLHKDYGEIIKQLTNDLETEQNKNDKLLEKQKELKSTIEKLKIDLTKSNDEYNTLKSNLNSLNKSSGGVSDSSTLTPDVKKCPKCGNEVQDGYLFCESCGTKL